MKTTLLAAACALALAGPVRAQHAGHAMPPPNAPASPPAHAGHDMPADMPATAGDWTLMGHLRLNGVYDHQSGPRGDDKPFVSGMVMGMARRPLGPGTLQLRAMLSPDPLMGRSGYPLLLASGETANGRDRLIDRQHPHDLFMELSTSYSLPVGSNAGVFV